jgi:glycosyltransferase involved in cell wall biosynthesis
MLGRRAGVDWRLFGRLYGLVSRERVDVVQTHHLGQLIYAAPATRLAGARLVHVEHDCHSLEPAKARRQLRMFARFCHRVVAVGEEIGEYLVREVRLPSSLVEVIQNGVDTRLYSPEPRRSRFELCLPADGRLIGHVGRLAPEKDHATLLKAFRSVAVADPRARLVLVGDGSLRSTLEVRAREIGVDDRVCWLGARTDVADLLPHFDVFVLSSIREGAPLSLLEAMAAARPVVSTRVGEVGRLVVNDVTGLVVEPGDPRGLAAAIATILSSPSVAARLGKASRAAVEQRFSLDRTVRAYEHLLTSLGDADGATTTSQPATPAKLPKYRT